MGAIFGDGEHRISTDEWKRRRDAQSKRRRPSSSDRGINTTRPQSPSPVWAIVSVLVIGMLIAGAIWDGDDANSNSTATCVSYRSDWDQGSEVDRDALRYKPCLEPSGDRSTVGEWFKYWVDDGLDDYGNPE